MHFSELAFQSKVLERHRKERFDDELTFGAFVGWQALVSKGYKKQFSSYLSDLGLDRTTKRKLTKEEKKRLTKKAYATGQRVMKSFKGLEL